MEFTPVININFTDPGEVPFYDVKLYFADKILYANSTVLCMHSSVFAEYFKLESNKSNNIYLVNLIKQLNESEIPIIIKYIDNIWNIFMNNPAEFESFHIILKLIYNTNAHMENIMKLQVYQLSIKYNFIILTGRGILLKPKDITELFTLYEYIIADDNLSSVKNKLRNLISKSINPNTIIFIFNKLYKIDREWLISENLINVNIKSLYIANNIGELKSGVFNLITNINNKIMLLHRWTENNIKNQAKFSKTFKLQLIVVHKKTITHDALIILNDLVVKYSDANIKKVYNDLFMEAKCEKRQKTE